MRLDPASLALRDYHKAKRLLWDPRDLDFAPDRADWAALTPREQVLLRQAVRLFAGGETAVTQDLAPLLIALRPAGRLEDTMFVTAQLFEESKHVEFFARFSEEVLEDVAPGAAGSTATTQNSELRNVPAAPLRDVLRTAGGDQTSE